MEIIEKSKLGMKILLDWIDHRIKKNKNVIIVIVGATGSGKTYGGLTVADAIGKRFGTNFSVKTNVGFMFDDLLRKMRLEENSKPATPFIFEEVGSIVSGASSGQWQSKKNQFFNSFTQTSRYKRQILIMTTPSYGNLDKKVRQLCHMLWETKHINFKVKIAHFKPYILQTSTKKDKIYYKYMRFSINGVRTKLDDLPIPHPPMDIAKAYELAKDEYQNMLEEKALESYSPTGVHKQRNRNIDYKYMDFLINQGKYSLAEIASMCKCSDTSVKIRKRTLKGIKKSQIRVNLLENQGFEGGNPI